MKKINVSHIIQVVGSLIGIATLLVGYFSYRDSHGLYIKKILNDPIFSYKIDTYATQQLPPEILSINTPIKHNFILSHQSGSTLQELNIFFSSENNKIDKVNILSSTFGSVIKYSADQKEAIISIIQLPPQSEIKGFVLTNGLSIVQMKAGSKNGYDATSYIEGKQNGLTPISKIVFSTLLIMFVLFSIASMPLFLRSKYVSEAQLNGDKNNNIIYEWGNLRLNSKLTLENASYSLLCAGTSNHRIVSDDLNEYYNWLEENNERTIGLLFLNPYSPHSVGRKRGLVQHSSADKTLESLMIASNIHERFICAVYDGPYRYTSRAIDLGPRIESNKKYITVISSTYLSGIAKGISTTILNKKHNEIFNFYENELLSLWKAAISSPPGHGIALVSDLLLNEDIDFIGICNKILGDYKLDYELQIFPAERIRIVIKSLSRTQSNLFDSPYNISARKESACLPLGYANFLSEIANSTLCRGLISHTVEFNKIFVNRDGYVLLICDYPENQLYQECFAFISSLVEKYSNYINLDFWNECLKEDSKWINNNSNYIIPYAIIGRVLDVSKSLPVPILLDQPTGYHQLVFNNKIDSIYIINFAYKTFIRSLGECNLTSETVNLDANFIRQALQI